MHCALTGSGPKGVNPLIVAEPAERRLGTGGIVGRFVLGAVLRLPTRPAISGLTPSDRPRRVEATFDCLIARDIMGDDFDVIDPGSGHLRGGTVFPAGAGCARVVTR